MQCIIYVAFSIVPQILPPLYGWGLFLSYITAGIYTLLRIIGMIAEVTSPSLPSATPQLSTATAVGKQMVMPVVIQLLCCIVVFTDVKVRRVTPCA